MNNQRKSRQKQPHYHARPMTSCRKEMSLIFEKSILNTRLHTEISKRSFEVERKNTLVRKS